MFSELIIGFMWIKETDKDIWNFVSGEKTEVKKAQIKKDGEYYNITFKSDNVPDTRIKGEIKQIQLAVERMLPILLCENR